METKCIKCQHQYFSDDKIYCDISDLEVVKHEDDNCPYFDESKL